MNLSPQELITLTGRTRRHAQRRMLIALGLKFGTRGDGSLVVLRAEVERVLGTPPREKPWVPSDS